MLHLRATSYAAFRSLLSEARLASGVTQSALAVALGCPQSVISKVERGERRLDFPEFVAWASVLGIDMHKFLNDYVALQRRPAAIGAALRDRPRKSPTPK